MKIIVLGAGLVGAPMALDLSGDENFDVTVADIDTGRLAELKKCGVDTHVQDLGEPSGVTALVKDYDIVLNAVPGFMGYRTLEAIIAAGRNVVDIAFFPEDPFPLDTPAKKNGVTAIVDCGVAPGMTNVLAALGDHRLDETESIVMYVGGLPECREWPYEYKAGFSPADVIEEYTRPARYVQNGEMVTLPALSERELLSFPPLGTLEAFNTDGLRTLAKTIDCPNMKEKTLRYPGHIERMAVLRETGFFGKEPIDVNGAKVRPLDLTSKLLFPMWKLDPGEIDCTVLKVIVEGRKGGENLRYTWDMFDRADEETGVHSMARTTGYTATAAVRLLADGRFDDKGLVPPEYLGRRPDCVEFLLKYLEDRGVEYREAVERV
jgi:saccharopine dehydrogenase-like NADP-dependent oxidoreductase